MKKEKYYEEKNDVRKTIWTGYIIVKDEKENRRKLLKFRIQNTKIVKKSLKVFIYKVYTIIKR